MKIRMPLLLACFVVFAQFARAQTPSPTPPNDEDVVKISTTLVQVDVTVTDKSGKVVTDLKPEEVEIYENGEKENITNFSFVSASPRPDSSTTAKSIDTVTGAPPRTLKPEQVKRTIALVVDDLTLSYESTHFVRQALQKFVNEQMQDGDLVAIIRTGGGIGALQQFTSDKRQLLAAIDKIRWNSNGTGKIGVFDPFQAGSQVGTADATNDTESPDMAAPTRDAQKEFNDLRESIYATGTLGALNYILRGMRELPGRKSIMLLSDGFKLQTDSSGFKEATIILDTLRKLADLANRASVVIYTMDARGLQTLAVNAEDDTGDLTTPDQWEAKMSERRDELFDSQEGLVYLARETGGFPVINSNDLSGGIRKMLNDQEGYYLVGYQPDSDTFDAKVRKFNKLVVKVKRPGVKVRYRSGFFGVADEAAGATAGGTAAKQTATEAITAALTSPFAVNGINVRLNGLFGEDPKTGPYVRSLLHIDAKDLKFTDAADGNHKATFEVVAMTFGDNGLLIDQLAKSYSLQLKGEDYKQILDRGFVYQFSFPMKKPGAYQLRVAIRDDGSEKIGSANQFIEVPDLKKQHLTLSGVVLENLTADQFRKLGSIAANANYRAEINSDPLTDTSMRRFKRGTVLRYAFGVYNAKAPNQTKTQIRVFRDGKLFFQGKPTPLDTTGQKDLQHLSASGAFNLGNQMETGNYVLQLIVTDNAPGAKPRIATQFSEFELVE
jgi:VWFA-related protein